MTHRPGAGLLQTHGMFLSMSNSNSRHDARLFRYMHACMLQRDTRYPRSDLFVMGRKTPAHQAKDALPFSSGSGQATAHLSLICAG
jgi:hypothetical protein